MKSIVSWNVNGIRAVEKKGFLEWLDDRIPRYPVPAGNESAQRTGQRPTLGDPVLARRDYLEILVEFREKGWILGNRDLFKNRTARRTKLRVIPEFDDEGRVVIADYSEFDGHFRVFSQFAGSGRTPRL